METTPETKGADKLKKNRSTAYPGVTLEQAVEGADALFNAYGKSSPFSRELAAKGMGFTGISGSSTAKVAALVHYGLLDRSADTYRLSDLAERIKFFTSEEDRQAALVEAALNPKLFKSLVTAYSGRSIPALLKNILITSHGIGSTAAENVANIFKKTIEFAGLYVNGVITETAGAVDDGGDGANPAPARPGHFSSAPHQQAKSTSPAGMHSVTLPSGIVISYPDDLAYLFAIGAFGVQIQALEAEVSKQKPNDNGNDNDTNTDDTATND